MLTQEALMNDRIVLVTGSTDGIGKETARQLAALGATVLVHGRNAARCQATQDEIRQATGNSRVDYFVADLSSQQQVRQLAADISARYDRLHVLINNAGVILLQRQVTEDGLETTFCRQPPCPFLAHSPAAGSVEKKRTRSHYHRQFDRALRRTD